MDCLVTTEWLAAEMAACDLRIIDASFHLPDIGRDSAAEFAQGHIPGASFMDLASLRDPQALCDNSLPSAESFAAAMQALGLGDGSRIILYDDSAIKSSARAWFMLRLFGAQDVAILDGGLAKWRAEGRPLETGEIPARPRHFTAWQKPGKLRALGDVLANIASAAEQVVDARPTARFAGNSPEPRPGISPGHIPGSINVPYGSLYTSNGTFKDKAGIRATFEDAGLDLARPVITSCGSGITACVLAFGLHLLGKDDVALYDGSWAEWGADVATPKARTEPA